jgi:hypothetical protein
MLIIAVLKGVADIEKASTFVPACEVSSYQIATAAAV